MKYIKANWPAHPRIRAYTTLKDGWCGSKSKRKELSKLLTLPSDPVWLNQQHTANAIDISNIIEKEPVADASFTNKANQVCAVITADCLPILLTDKEATHVVAIHAGWRGLSQGIIEQTIAALSLAPQEIIAWLGPAIGPKKYEVGDDVYEAFTRKHPESARGFYALKSHKWLADLYTLAKIRLNEQGVLEVYGGDFCTYTQKDMFYSYRREKEHTGHMATLIWIEN